MTSKYDDHGNFLGTLVENLTDDPLPIVGEPLGTIGQWSPSHALDPFQRELWNLIPTWGIRRVYHETYGSVLQACVRSFDESAWINI